MGASARRGCRPARCGGGSRAGGGGAWRARADRRGGNSCSETTDDRADGAAHARCARRALTLGADRRGAAVVAGAIHVVSLELFDDEEGKRVHGGSCWGGPWRDHQVTSEARVSTSGSRAHFPAGTPYSLT